MKPSPVMNNAQREVDRRTEALEQLERLATLAQHSIQLAIQHCANMELWSSLPALFDARKLVITMIRPPADDQQRDR